MTRQEAEKKVIAYGSSCWVSGSNDDCMDKKFKKAQDKLRQELINALCAEPAAPKAAMSLEEFMVQVARVLSGKAPAKELEAIYDRMSHSADASKEGISGEFYAPISMTNNIGLNHIHLDRAVQFLDMLGSIKSDERIGHFHIIEIKEN